jgi:hypothetical protein
MAQGVTIRVRIGMMGLDLRNNRCLFFGMPGKFQFNPIKGNKNFLILGNDNSMQLRPAPYSREDSATRHYRGTVALSSVIWKLRK